jgi:hypothetical protein
VVSRNSSPILVHTNPSRVVFTNIELRKDGRELLTSVFPTIITRLSKVFFLPSYMGAAWLWNCPYVYSIIMNEYRYFVSEPI